MVITSGATAACVFLPISQRKPWASMAESVTEALDVSQRREVMLAGWVAAVGAGGGCGMHTGMPPLSARGLDPCRANPAHDCAHPCPRLHAHPRTPRSPTQTSTSTPTANQQQRRAQPVRRRRAHRGAAAELALDVASQTGASGQDAAAGRRGPQGQRRAQSCGRAGVVAGARAAVPHSQGGRAAGVVGGAWRMACALQAWVRGCRRWGRGGDGVVRGRWK